MDVPDYIEMQKQITKKANDTQQRFNEKSKATYESKK